MDNNRIQSGELTAIPSGIFVAFPTGTYAHIVPHDEFALHLHISTIAGVINPDYRSGIKVLLHNVGTKPQTIKYTQQ